MKKLQKRSKTENSVKMYKTIACPCACWIPHAPIWSKSDDQAYTKKANNK